MSILSTQCDYNAGHCDHIVVMLLLVICPEGHIKEKHLCAKHHLTYHNYLRDGEIHCPTCGLGLTTEYLERGLYDAL